MFNEYRMIRAGIVQPPPMDEADAVTVDWHLQFITAEQRARQRAEERRRRT